MLISPRWMAPYNFATLRGGGFAAFALVFAGCGAIITNAQYGEALGTVGIARLRAVIM